MKLNLTLTTISGLLPEKYNEIIEIVPGLFNQNGFVMFSRMERKQRTPVGGSFLWTFNIFVMVNAREMER